MLNKYKSELLSLYSQGIIDENVEIFLNGNISKPSFPTCEKCDILGCIGDEELNYRETGERKIPSYTFCELRKVEKQVAELIKGMGI